VVIKGHFDFLLVGFAVVGASELVVVFILGFALFGTVQGELAAADELEFFVGFAVAAFACERFFLVPENPAVLDVFHFN
jgi:hypothetical protein